MQIEDDVFMERCLELAAKAKAAGKTPVGAIVVKGGEIVAEGIEGDARLPALLAHAEIIAIIDTVDKVDKKNLSDFILYTTVEPCIMCSYLIRETNLGKIVYGTEAGEIGGAKGQSSILTENDIAKWNCPPIIKGGVKKEECLTLLQKLE